MINGRKGVSYEGPPPTATIIRSPTTFEEFMEKIYQVTGYEKSYTRLAVTCRYPVRKEYIALPIIDQETMEIAFAVVEAPGNSVELYISASEEYPSHEFSVPHAGAHMEREAGPSHTPYHEGGSPTGRDSDSDGADPVPNRSAVNLNTVPEIIGEEVTSFEVYACNENVSRMLTEEEIEEAEAIRIDAEPISYMEPPAPEFENAATWSDVAVAHMWLPYPSVSQPADDGAIYEGQIFGSKEEVVHAIKAQSIKSHQQYCVYKSSTTLLKQIGRAHV